MTWTIALLAALLALGQLQPASPGLEQRPKGSGADEQAVTVVRDGAHPILPADAYGLYRFSDREGSFGEGLQINEQFGEISGYFSIAVGHNKLASYFLSQVKGGDGDLSFTTKQVHGVWYSFDGKPARGPGLTRAQDGYYLLDGTLTTHDDARKTQQSRTVSMKLTGQH